VLKRSENIPLQLIGIAVLGLGIGAADALFLRPVRLDVEKVDVKDFLTPSPGGQTTPAPVEPAPTPNAPGPGTSTPAEQPPVVTPKEPPPAQPPTPPQATEKSNHISVPDAFALYQRVATGECFFIDARKFELFEQGHVAESIPLNLKSFDTGMPPQLQVMDPSKPIVVYCGGGNCDESEAVGRQLNNFGYKFIFIMHDGFPAWQSAGHPVGTGKHPLHDALKFTGH
jgi:rhodanese-related sulfurtransferase